ncbi:MAG: glycoside hydrolase family 9 protein [Opitutales bacterium]|nr:glycoside hydrolase family 9 protein [Opitutales bacterium]
MNRLNCLLALTLCFSLFSAQSASAAARLASGGPLDNGILLLHIEEGIVEHLDDASGPSAFGGPVHEPRLNQAIHFGQLAVGPATTPGNWTLSSPTDANYGAGGAAPVQVHRKSKMNGMAELGWSEPWDYDYEFTLEHFLYLRLPHPLQQGATYTLTIPAAANVDTASVTFTYDIFEQVSEAIKVNLVGYRDDDSIKAVDIFAWMGDGGARDYSGHQGNQVYIRNVATGQTYPVGTVQFWKASATEADGNNFALSDVWKADFTGFQTPGTYRVAVEGIGSSQDFEIGPGIYRAPFKVSTRGFFYMRIGQDSLDMTPVPRRPLFMPGQDGFKVYETTLHPFHPDWEIRRPVKDDPWDDFEHFSNYSTGVEHTNAWGGHSDALDWDRHLAHVSIIYDLLLPYFLSGGAIDDDDLGIAESGNGIPDVIDEARYEVDFFLRIRTSDGGYSHGLSDISKRGDFFVPSSQPRAYLAAATPMAAWANAANAAMLADAFRIAGETALMEHYRDEAIAAFNHVHSMPLGGQMLDLHQEIGEGIMRGRDFKQLAAAHLYNVTGDTQWEAIIEAESVVRDNNSARIIIEYQSPQARNQLYATAAYLTTERPVNFPQLRENMRTAIINQAFAEEAGLRHQRPSRRSIDNNSGYFITVQNVHRTILAHAVATDPQQRADLLDALTLEADWGLGRNPLNMIKMTTASTSLATKRSVVDAYTSGRNDGTPGLHPGHTPYMNMHNWDSSMIMGTPSILYDLGYPSDGGWWNSWPRGELFYNTRFSWPHGEHTPQQTMRGKQALYGYLYALDAEAFEGERFSLTLVAENGTVERSPQRSLYNEGTSVTLTAQGNNGFAFGEWQGDASGSANPLTLTMDADKIITAVFVPVPQYTLTVNNGSGGGQFSEGFATHIVANAPPAGQIFAGWTGDTAHLADAAAATTTVTMPGFAITVTATFDDLPPPPDDIVIYRSGQSEIDGIWGDGLEELSTGGFGGGTHYRWAYAISGWWSSVGLTLDGWGGQPAFDVSRHESLSLAVNGPSNAAHQFRIRLISRSDGEGPWVQIPQTQPYGIVLLPIAELIGGNLDATQIREIQFSMVGVEIGAGEVFFDDIVFVAAASGNPDPEPEPEPEPNPDPTSTHTDKIRVDQFGYLPDATKVAVIADPQVGWNSAESFTPGATLELRRVGDGSLVFSGAPTPWNGGATHAQSGDRVWWFDFTSVSEPGLYRIHDPANNAHSDSFAIGADIYDEVLRQAVRMFFYQRSGFAKEVPYAHPNWADAASHPQDANSRPIWDPNNAALERDLSGGWFDAGDYNKYSEWTGRAIMELLLAYLQRPDVFTDDFGIPESGNGIPDLLDEVKWGMDWLLRMQESNGAVLGKVSVTQHQSASPPSTDNHPRYYGPVSTEATAMAAAAFALGATAFDSVGMNTYAATLEAAAIAAWNWTVANPNVPFDNTGFASVSPSRNAHDTLGNRVMAATMLFERTGDPVYRDFFDAHYLDMEPVQWWFFYPFQGELQKALAHYTTLPGATPAVANDLRTRMASSINGPEFLGAWNDQLDAYRAFLKDVDYVWGSNKAKAQAGLLFTNVRMLGLNPADATAHRDAAMGYLHYLHGVNPMAMVYLSNMYAFGAYRSANEMYHHWFRGGSDWSHALTSLYGPAPGFLVGGPSAEYTGSIQAIRDQPPQKAYLDWNGLYPENSWEITEPDINYQTSYIHLLSALMPVRDEAGSGLVETWPTAASITFGQTLAAASLSGGSATVAGEFAFANPSLAPAAGTQFHTIVFTPEDTTSHDPVPSSIPVTVLKAPATITLSNLEHVFDGTPKSALAETVPAGLAVALTYNGSSQAPVNVGTYTVAANITDPNHTGSATATLTIAEGDLPPPPDTELVVYRDATTLITGTWGDGLQELTTGGFEGNRHYRWNYTIAGWWGGIGLNLDNWGGGPTHDVSSHEFLSFALDGPSNAAHPLTVQLVSAGDVNGPAVSVPRTQPYGRLQIPLADLVGESSLDLTQIREIVFGLGGVESGTGTLYLDDIVFLTPAAEPEPADLYATWAAANDIVGGMTDETGGVSNLLRYALGGHADTPLSTLIPQMQTNVDPLGLTLRLTFYRIDDPLVNYAVWYSEDLSDWGSAPLWEDVGAPDGTPGFFHFEVPTTSARGFLRLEVSR